MVLLFIFVKIIYKRMSPCISIHGTESQGCCSEKSDMVNESHNVLRDAEWAEYYHTIDNDMRYNPNLQTAGKRTTEYVNGKLLLVEMQHNGEFAAKDIYKKSSVNYAQHSNMSS